MRQDPFPDPGEDDGEEPEEFPPPYAESGPEQGLFLCLPAGEFDPDQFAQSGPASDLPPGATTATLMELVGGAGGSSVAGLSDDQLVGFIAAAKRQESWSAWFAMPLRARRTQAWAGRTPVRVWQRRSPSRCHGRRRRTGPRIRPR